MTTETPAAGAPRFTDPNLVELRFEDGVAIVTVQVECFSDHDAERIAGACLELAGRDGHVRQAVSLGLVREVTCAGLRALVQVSATLRARGGRLIIFGASPEVRQVVRRTGLGLTMAQGAREAIRLARSDEPGRRGLRSVFGRTRAA